MNERFVHSLHGVLFDAGLPCYGVIDAARLPSVYTWLQSCQAGEDELQQRSLFSGTSAITLAEQAPYLVRLPPRHPRVLQLLAYGWGRSMGIFVHSRAGFEDLRLALKKKLVLRDAQGRRLYFRFYDPRVVRAFLVAADHKARQWWFDGPFESFLFEAQDARALLVDRRIIAGMADGLRTLTPDGWDDSARRHAT